MLSRIFCFAGYIALTGIFATAAVFTQPETPAVSMSSITVEKTNRLNVGSPDLFLTERFAS